MTFCWDFLLCGCFGCCRQKEAKKVAALRTVQDTSSYQGPRIFTLKELTAATKEFSAEELLGRGAFGSVYKGTLGDGSVVAVKQIAQDSHQDEREFLAEVSIISRIRHRNLVQLQGWCHEKGSLLLVYDYMPNGSLDKLLEGHGGGAVAKDAPATGGGLLPWDVRQKILKGVAAALAYLHDDCQQCVLHRDVKPSNVLLDAKFNPHLADFGLARLIDHRTENVQTTIIAGTRGYLAPELVQVGKVSTKSDVFSFGVLALEVVCGRRPLDRNLPDQYHIGLVDCAWRAHESNDLLSLVDPRLGNAYDANKLTNIMKIGLFCCHPDPEARPPMSFVRQYFISEVPLPPLPSSKPLVTYSLGPRSPSKPAAAQQQALAAPEPKLAIEGPPAGKALAIEGPPKPPEAIANEAQAPHMVHKSLATEAPPPTTETSGSSSNHINPSRGNSQDSSLQSSQKFLQSSSARP